MMNPNMSFFMHQAHGFQPFASGLPPQMHTGFEGLPFVGQHPMLQFAAQPILQQLMASQGMTPMGFGHDMNHADIMRHRQFQLAQQQTAAAGGQLDQENMMRIIRGGYAAAGKPWTEQHQQMASAGVQLFDQYMMPMIAMQSPGLADALMGGTSGRSLGMNVAQMGRYRVDPVTGQMGMSADSSIAMMQGLRGIAGSSAVYGLGGGSLGSAASALHQLGLLGHTGGSIRDRTIDVMTGQGGFTSDQLKSLGEKHGINMAGGVSKLTASDIDKLSLDPAIADRIRSVDVNRTIKVVKEYSGALKAMGEIFSEMGKPGTGALEQLQGLQQLSGGLVGKVDHKTLMLTVRQNANTLQAAGLTLDQGAMIQSHFSNTAAAMGLPNAGAFGTEAMANTAAFMAHYQDPRRAWLAGDTNQIAQMRGQLEIGGAASNVANRAGVLSRVSETVGGFQAGSAAAAMMDAMKAGRDTFVDPATGQLRSIDMKDKEFRSMMMEARGANGEKLHLSNRAIDEMINQREVNSEYVQKGGFGKLVGRSQEREVANMLGARLGGVMAGVAGDLGKSISGGAGRAMATRIMHAVNEMSDDVKRDPAKWKTAVASEIEKEMRAKGLGTQLDAMSAEERKKFLAQAADRMHGGAEHAIPTSRFGGTYGSYANYLRASGSRETEAKADVQRLADRIRGENQDAASGASTPGGPLTRAIDELWQGLPRGLSGLMGTMFGGVDASKQRNFADKRVAELDTLKRAIDTELAKVNAMPEGPSKRRELSKLEAMRSEVGRQQADMKGLGDSAAATLAAAASGAQQGSSGDGWGTQMFNRLFDKTGGEKTGTPKPADNSPAGTLKLEGTLKLQMDAQQVTIDAVTAGAVNAAGSV